MEPFKIALKIAIDRSADKISFVEGRLPVMWQGDKEVAMNHQPIVQKILLSQLFASFFPSHQEKLIEGQPVQGPLKVVDVGDLILLAIPGKPAALNVYFPGAGEQFFADDWRSLARVRNAEPALDMPAASQSAANEPELHGVTASDCAVPPPPPLPSGDFRPSGPAEPLEPTEAKEPVEAPVKAPLESAPLKNTAPKELPIEAKIEPQMEPKLDAKLDIGGDGQAEREEKLGTTSDPNINFRQTQDFSSVEVSQLRPIPTESLDHKPRTVIRAREVAKGPIKVDGKDIGALLALMTSEGYDQLVLTSDSPAAFWVRGEMTLSDTPLTATAINIAIETLFPDASPKGAPSMFHRWHQPTGSAGFRLHGSFGHGKPWLSITRKIDPLSASTGELLIPEGITDLAALDRGLVIISGEQNSGKSTTAHQLVDRINQQRCRHILILQNEDAAQHQTHKSCIRSLCATGWTESTLSSLATDPADTLIVDGAFHGDLIEPLLLALGQGKLVFWVLPGPSGNEALFSVLRRLAGQNRPDLGTQLLSRLVALVSQALMRGASADGQRHSVPLFEAWRLTDRQRRFLMDQWQKSLGSAADSLFELLGPAAAPGISFEKSILNALALGAITPAELQAQFFDKARLAKLFADAGIDAAGSLIDSDSLEAS